MVKYNLENEGYNVEACNSTEEAHKLDLTIFSLILTDATMNGISGMAFANMVKQNPATAHIPIILCSEKTHHKDVVSGLNTGADDYIIKPFSMRELTARVQSVLRRSDKHSNATK